MPPALLDALPGQVWVVEPRRIAARGAAHRIAAERGTRVGEEIGYHVRFDNKTSAQSRLIVMTEGILLARLQSDPFLEGVSAVVFDEFHERRLDADLALALVANVRREVREDLAVVVMSATFDPAPVAAWLGDADTVYCEGRSFPVAVENLLRTDDRALATQAAAAIVRALEQPGDVLVFLPGIREIRATAERLQGQPVDVLMLYGSMAPEDQDVVLQQGSRRRVILATNVAETSITVPGITTVVDSGLAKGMRFDPSTGLSRLEVHRISRASADQRAGRAGRLGPGRCLRLWTEREDRALADYELPEVARADLCSAALHLLAWGEDPTTMPWFEAPPPTAMTAAMSVLHDLGAQSDGCITPLGRRLAPIPLHPRLARLLLAADDHGHGEVGAQVAAMLSDADPLWGQVPTRSSSSDLLDRIDAVDVRTWRHLTRPLQRYLIGPSGPVLPRDEAIGRAVLAAWPDRVVARRSHDAERGRMVGGKGVVIKASAVHDPLFVAVDVSDGAEALVRMASAVDPAWLEQDEATTTDIDNGTARTRTTWSYRDLPLRTQTAALDRAAASHALHLWAQDNLDRVLPTHDAWVQLLARWQAAHEWDASLPAPNPSTLGDLLSGLCHGLRSAQQLQDADWAGAVRDWLGWNPYRRLQALAPAELSLSNGRTFSLDWTGPRPVLAARIQHLLGVSTTPTVGPGVPVLLHLLAPNRRVQQVTDDLEGFWRGSYHDIRKELRARYPKHDWPENP